MLLCCWCVYLYDDTFSWKVRGEERRMEGSREMQISIMVSPVIPNNCHKLFPIFEMILTRRKERMINATCTKDMGCVLVVVVVVVVVVVMI